MPVIMPGRPEAAPAKDKVEAEQQDDQHDNGHDHGEKPHGTPPNIIRMHRLLLIQVLSLQLHPGYFGLAFLKMATAMTAITANVIGLAQRCIYRLHLK
jgi:hypothetical protein